MVVPMMETWIVIRAVKQADEGRDITKKKSLRKKGVGKLIT